MKNMHFDILMALGTGFELAIASLQRVEKVVRHSRFNSAIEFRD